MGNVPILRFKEFEGAWEEVQLGEIVSFRKGKGIAKKDISDIGEPCILYGELYTKYNEVIDKIQSRTDVSINNPIIGMVNDVLIPASGETALDIATASSLTVDDVLIGGDINLLTPKEEVNGLFISYQINNKQKNELAKFAEGASVVHLYKDGIRKLRIYLPIHKEQVKISEFFKLMSEKIKRQEEKIELLKEQKKGYMQKIFNRELRFKDENGKVFPDWKEIKLGDICKVSNGNSDVQDTVENGKYPFFDRSIEKRNLNEYHFNNEALIYSGEGSKFYPRYFKGKYGLHQRCYTLYNFEEEYLTKFFYYRMSMLDSNNYFLKVAVGTTVKSLRMENFHKYKLLVPSYREQEKIVSFLQLLDMELKENQFKYNCFISQKRGFMQQMFV